MHRTNTYCAKSYQKTSLVILLFIVIFSSCKPTKYVPEDKFLLNDITLTCNNNSIDFYELESYIKQKANKKILPLKFNLFGIKINWHFGRFHLGIYNMVKPLKVEKEIKKRTERKQKKLNRKNKRRLKKGKTAIPFERTKGRREWFQGIGEPPVVYDEYLKDKSVSQMKQYLRNKGYYYAEIKDSVYFRKKRKADVFYTIETGKAYYLKTIDYQIEDSLIAEVFFKDTVNSLIKENIALDMDILRKERDRINDLMKTHGYFAFLKEYVYYKIDTAFQDYSVSLTIGIKNVEDELGNFHNHKKYIIRDIYFYTNWNPKLAMQEKEKYLQRLDTLKHPKGYYFVYENEIGINPEVIIAISYIKKLVPYNQNDVQDTYQQLSSLKNYKLININFEEVVFKISSNYHLNCHIYLTPLVKQSYSAEIEGTNSSGNIGMAGSLNYQHKSIFKGAEVFNIGLRGGLEVQNVIDEESQADLPEYLPFNTTLIGTDVSVEFPKFMIPFFSNKFRKFIRTYKPRTKISVGYDFQKRPDYTRTITNASYGYNWEFEKEEKYRLKHSFNPIEINSVLVSQLSPEFQARIQNTYLEKSYDSLFISSINYGFEYSNIKKTFSRNKYYFRGKVETAGNVFSTYNSIFKTAKTDDSYTVLGTKYAQYFKTDLEFKYNFAINKNSQIVCRFFNGLALPFGNTSAIPFVKQYFGGGANGMRAWQVYKLGPGSYIQSIVRPFQTADYKLEANIEYRFNLFWMLDGALFVDAGNIWSVSKNDDRPGALFNPDLFYKEIAIGTGFGLRFDFSFFVFRTDLGIKVKDPMENEGERWIFLDNGLKKYDYVINLAIGYPF
ncbi:MAG: BamA/TamA family outer membrane protein [Bacteroidales bacterium]|nr:BamA/TamA family outer membrane protein [Bacteroidales bacterium]